MKAALPTLEAAERDATAVLDATVAGLPNQPLDAVPVGGGEADNVLVREWGTKPAFAFAPREHFAIGAVVWVRHAANIRRLMNGTEPKIGKRA